MNQLVITGNLVRDPEMRDLANDRRVCTFTVAVNRNRDETDFVRVSAWDRLGDTCYSYLAKGRKVLVTGRVTAHGYKDQSGNPRASLELTANQVEFLTPRNQQPAQEAAPAQETAPSPEPAPAARQTEADFYGDDDELPF